MMYRKFFRGPFLFLLTVVMLAGCNRQDDLDGIPSVDTPTGMPTGAIAFTTAGNMETRAISACDREAVNWEMVTVSLDDGPRASGTSAAASRGTVSSEGSSSETVISGGASSGLLTRGAPVEGTDAPAGSIGVLGFLLAGGTWSGSETPSFMYNMQLTRTGNSGSYSYTYSPAKYWPDDTDDKVRFFAYYPYEGNGISLSSPSATGYPTISFTPAANVTDQVDLLYASTNAVNNRVSGSAVNFSLAHSLARISFSFKLEAALDGITTTVQSVELTGLKSSGTLSLDPSAATPWTPGAGTASYTASAGNGALLPTANQSLNTGDYKNVMTYTGYLLLLPQSVSESNTAVINYTVDGVAKKSTYYLSDATWGMGQSLNYQVTLTEVPVVPPADPSNCHFIAPGSALVIPVGIKGEGGDVAGTGLSTTHTAASVGIVWQTSAGLITLGAFNSGKQTVAINANSSGTTGNAVVAAYSGAGQTGDILWSWHIWVTDYDPDTPSGGAVHTYNNRTWMDRNLGATTATVAQPTTLGLFYQWGRKDPFPASASASTNVEPTLYDASGTGSTSYITKVVVAVANNLNNSILNPKTFYTVTGASTNWYSNSSSIYNNALWSSVTPGSVTDKTIFDPCPAGWRVPAFNGGYSDSPWQVFNATTFPWYDISDWTIGYGRVYPAAGNTYYPATGYRYFGNGTIRETGTTGYYFSATCRGTTVNSSYHFTFANNDIGYARAGTQGNGEAIRCIRE